jgi:hypothetical protein
VRSAPVVAAGFEALVLKVAAPLHCARDRGRRAGHRRAAQFQTVNLAGRRVQLPQDLLPSRSALFGNLLLQAAI